MKYKREFENLIYMNSGFMIEIVLRLWGKGRIITLMVLRLLVVYIEKKIENLILFYGMWES